MKIGIPREIKILEGRVALTPGGARMLAERGHEVIVQASAGAHSGIADGEYAASGARIVPGADEIWGSADMIVKVKEPFGPEFDLMREGQVVFTYLHLAANRELALKLMERRAVGIAYETIQLPDGGLPLLAPMSEIAGRLAVQSGSACLEEKNGGRGILLGGVPGVARGVVAVIGGGISGQHAAGMALGMGARVTVLDVNIGRLRSLDELFQGRVGTLVSDRSNIEESCLEADLVVGAVLIPGGRPPRLLTRDLFRRMKSGAAFVDISIDQGGCAETSRPTDHRNPIYLDEGIVHYCVTNMPGAVPRTSTYALTNATLPYALALADKGYRKAMAENEALARGLNTFEGALTCRQAAEGLGLNYTEVRFD